MERLEGALPRRPRRRAHRHANLACSPRRIGVAEGKERRHEAEPCLSLRTVQHDSCQRVLFPLQVTAELSPDSGAPRQQRRPASQHAESHLVLRLCAGHVPRPVLAAPSLASLPDALHACIPSRRLRKVVPPLPALILSLRLNQAACAFDGDPHRLDSFKKGLLWRGPPLSRPPEALEERLGCLPRPESLCHAGHGNRCPPLVEDCQGLGAPQRRLAPVRGRCHRREGEPADAVYRTRQVVYHRATRRSDTGTSAIAAADAHHPSGARDL